MLVLVQRNSFFFLNFLLIIILNNVFSEVGEKFFGAALETITYLLMNAVYLQVAGADFSFYKS